MRTITREDLRNLQPISMSVMLHSPIERAGADESKIEKYAHATQTANVHGVTPRFYEPSSPWVEYECACGNMFWLKGSPSAARSCRQARMQCKDPVKMAGQARLQLTGQKFGSLEVMGHMRGKGWVVKCVCGRERTLLNGTALGNGAYKTCGLCTEEERKPKGAHSDDLRSSSFADQNLKECHDGHISIRWAHDDGSPDCPLCVIMAKIEMMEG